ncbi:MAG: hypothetical protein IKW97_04215 [Muribaculaceae bacterium]|nr:hypothetical protein [Muribaculaceae bacterium]
MEQTIPQNLKYGIIYLYSDRHFSPGVHDPEAIVQKFVYPLQVRWINQPGRKDLLLVARRFNVGNIGQYATVSLSLSRMNRSGGWFEAIRHFADELMGVTDAGEGDIVINEADYGYRYDLQSSMYEGVSEAAPQDHTRVEPADRPVRRLVNRMTKKRDILPTKDIATPKTECRSAREVAPRLEDEELSELKRIERGRERALERIKQDIINYIAQYHDDPKDLMAELLRGKVIVGSPGRLLVNGDMKIVVPEYDETEIQMTAMCRTLYILFMKQRKQGKGGIVLKNMDEYSEDIIGIYSMVKPGADHDRVVASVKNLCDPFSESLNQTISRINRCVRSVITDKDLVKQYMITGTRGEAYSINLAPEQMELPRAVTA